MHKLIAATIASALVASTLLTLGCASSSPDKERLGKALIYHQDGRHEQAIKEYNEVMTMHAHSPEIYFNLGQIYERRGDIANAKDNYQLAISYYTGEQQQKKSEAHLALGALYFITNDFTNAREQFELASRADPANPRAHYNIGVAYEAQIESNVQRDVTTIGIEENALAAYHKALDLHPQFADAHLMLAFVYERRGDIERANFHHSRARQNGLDDPLLVLRLDWWSDWLEQELTARSRTETPQLEGKVVIRHPRPWTLGTSARAGTIIVRTYNNTFANVIGQNAAVQIDGPRGLSKDRPADMTPSRFAQGQLLDWLETNNPSAARDYKAWHERLERGEQEDVDAENDNGAFDDRAREDNGDFPALRTRGNFYGFEEEAVAFADGTTGYKIRATFAAMDGTDRLITFYYYYGQAHSYVLITTQHQVGEEIDRTHHTLERIVHGFREETRVDR